jgi:hypothetical protein
MYFLHFQKAQTNYIFDPKTRSSFEFVMESLLPNITILKYDNQAPSDSLFLTMNAGFRLTIFAQDSLHTVVRKL